MKETLTLLWAAVLYLALGSCDDETCEREVTYTKATPVFGQIDKYRLPITNTRIAPIVNPGHYILIDTILFVLDIDRGIHVVSSQNSQHINYINIPGIREFVIEDDTLVANSYYDVLQIDIARPQHAKLIYREEEAFPIPFYNERGL
ncbi:MAG: hypothetical protein KDC53_10935, partial [Saprospiraceae bacterium]|nr:hypothetical protein [Saprospiraceae bacterium]